MAAFFWLVSRLPDRVTRLELEFGVVLAPVWGIVVASIITPSSSTPSRIQASWVARFGGGRRWGRVLFGDAIAMQLEAFCCLCWSGDPVRGPPTRGGVVDLVGECRYMKALITVISIPWIYWVHPAVAATYTQNDR